MRSSVSRLTSRSVRPLERARCTPRPCSSHAPVAPASRSLSSSACSQRGSSTSASLHQWNALRLIVELALGELGEPLVHRLAIRPGQLGQLDLVDAVQLAELARRLVERLEDRADLHLEVALVEHLLERGRASPRASGGPSGSRGRPRRRPCGRRAGSASIWPSRNCSVGDLVRRRRRAGSRGAGSRSARATRAVCVYSRSSASTAGLLSNSTLEDAAVGRDRLGDVGRAPARGRARGATADRPGAARRATCSLSAWYSCASGLERARDLREPLDVAERELVARVVAQRARVRVERGVRVADHLLVERARCGAAARPARADPRCARPSPRGRRRAWRTRRRPRRSARARAPP